MTNPLFEEFTLPAFWASALINNDYSGLSDQEEAELNGFIDTSREENAMFYCVGVSDDSWFSTSNDAGALAGDVATFTFQIK